MSLDTNQGNLIRDECIFENSKDTKIELQRAKENRIREEIS